MKILLHPSFELSLVEMIEVLYEKDYFSFYEGVEEYVKRILSFIETNINKRSKKLAPPYFRRLIGKKDLFFIFYKPNRKTTWYIFFTFCNDDYLVWHITNNHKDGHHIRGTR